MKKFILILFFLLPHFLFFLSCSAGDEKMDDAAGADWEEIYLPALEDIYSTDRSITYLYGNPEQAKKVMRGEVDLEQPGGDGKKLDPMARKGTGPRKFYRLSLKGLAATNPAVRNRVLNKLKLRMAHDQFDQLLSDLGLEKNGAEYRETGEPKVTEDKFLFVPTKNRDVQDIIQNAIEESQKPRSERTAGKSDSSPEKDRSVKKETVEDPEADPKESTKKDHRNVAGGAGEKDNKKQTPGGNQGEDEKGVQNNSAPTEGTQNSRNKHIIQTKRYSAIVIRSGEKTTRLKEVVNSPRRDYRLRQSPRSGDSYYYIMSNRIDGIFRILRLETTINNGLEIFHKKHEIVKIPEVNSSIIGYDMCFTNGEYHLVYSHNCNLYEATSEDGLNFDNVHELNMSTDSCERDPALSSDCMNLAFSRSYVDGKMKYEKARVYYTKRSASDDEDFEEPNYISSSYNFEGSNAPFFYFHKNVTYIIFSRNMEQPELCSSEIRPDGSALLPVSMDVNVQGKYPFCSFTKRRGWTCFISLWVDGYEWDIFHMEMKDPAPYDLEVEVE